MVDPQQIQVNFGHNEYVESDEESNRGQNINPNNLMGENMAMSKYKQDDGEQVKKEVNTQMNKLEQIKRAKEEARRQAEL